MLAVLERRLPDRVPFSPRLELWLAGRAASGSLPARFRGMKLAEVEDALGVVAPARGAKVFDEIYDGVEVVQRVAGDRTVTEYRTPVGTARTVVRKPMLVAQAGMASLVEEYPLKSPQDYRTWEYVLEATSWAPCPREYERYDRAIADRGLPLVTVGDVPFHTFLQKLAGYEHAYYHIADEPQLVESLVGVADRIHRERLWPAIESSPARFVNHGSHISSQMTPPPLFERWILPYYEDFAPRLHGAGKVLAMHADADLSLLLPLVRRAGWDVLECFVTAPMVPLTLEQTRRAFGDRVILWGGIPSVILSPSWPEESFRAYVRRVLEVVAPGEAFILGVADNVMPDSLIERVAWIVELLEAEGACPLPRPAGATPAAR